MKKIFLLIFFYSVAVKADIVPADSLLNKNIPVSRKITIYPIKLWQSFSFKSSRLNCQFYPSCSQFTAIAISSHGIVMGSIMGADRIIRCNPAAFQHHDDEFHNDGRLKDRVPNKLCLEKPGIDLAYNILPGLGRIKKGRSVDGLFSLLLESSMALVAYKSYEQEYYGLSVTFASTAMIFWLSDFYFYLKK